MFNLFTTLAKNPDDAVAVQDDKRARACLYQLRISEVFSNDRKLSERPTVQICGIDHLTHFILVFLFSGCSAKKENGYVVTCAPKSAFAPSEIIDNFVEGAVREQSLMGYQVIRCSPPAPSKN